VAALACTAPNPAYLLPSASADAASANDDATSPDPPVDARLTLDHWLGAADRSVDTEPALDLPMIADLSFDLPPELPDAAVEPAPVPAGLTITETGGMSSRQGGPGGTSHTDLCPQDQVLVGYRGSLGLDNGGDLVVYSLEGQCGSLTVGSASPYAIKVVTGGKLTVRGGGGTTTFTSSCPANQVVLGMAGRSGALLDQLQLECAPLSIAGTTVLSVSIGAGTLLAGKGGTAGSAFRAPCPAGQMARGQLISDGAVIDSLALVCGSPTVVVK
jgi:hypothetical protein